MILKASHDAKKVTKYFKCLGLPVFQFWIPIKENLKSYIASVKQVALA